MQELSNSAMQGCPDEQHTGYPACKHMAEILPQSMFIVDAKGRMVKWSPWFRDRITGLTDEHLESTDFLDLVHPDDRELLNQRMQKILSKGVEESAEVRVLLKGGPACRWFLLIANRFERDGRHFLTGTGIDITRLKKAGMALMHGEQRFRSMFEQSDSPVFITGTDGSIVYVSPAFEALSGYQFQECQGSPFIRFFEDDADGGKALSMLTDVLANAPAVVTREFRMFRKDGTVCYVELKLQRYHDNRTEGAIGVLYDLTQRKRLEFLNQFRVTLLQQAARDSIDDILHSAIDQAAMFTGSTFGFIFFLSESTISWSKCVCLAHTVDHDCILKSLEKQHLFEMLPFLGEVVEQRRAVIVNENSAFEHAQLPQDHSSLKNTLVVPFIDNDQVVALLLVANKPSSYDDGDARWLGTLVDMVWDIIARKKAEQSELRIQSILLQIQKMEIIGQLAGGIAHDFNNMLGVILGNTELALTSEILEPSVEENLQEIYRAAERSAEMTSQLLAFARKQTAVPRVLDVDEAIGKTMDILRQVAGEKIVIEWQPSGLACKVRIDPSQLDQILMNFSLNARDAINGSGKIVIETKRIHVGTGGDKTAHIGVAGDYVMISVSDSGQGIPDKYKPHIFEPFFTTKVLGKGTGLGLSSVYGLVKQNRGFVDFESMEGSGSTFHACLPLYRANAEFITAENGQVPGFGGQATILVVEDEPEILNLCRMMLEKSGYTVFAAKCPSEAIVIAEERSGTIDLLLTDIVMPEMNGTDLSSKLSTICPGFRVLFMSGYSADIVANHGVPNPAINLIRKPFTLKTLADKVRKTLEVE